MKAITGRSFSSASWRIRWNSRCDWTGEPPGELITSATARALRIAKARSSGRATWASVRPGRNGVEKPITPESLTTGTTGMSPRKRFGSSGWSVARAAANSWPRCSDMGGSAIMFLFYRRQTSPDFSHGAPITFSQPLECLLRQAWETPQAIVSIVPTRNEKHICCCLWSMPSPQSRTSIRSGDCRNARSEESHGVTVARSIPLQLTLDFPDRQRPGPAQHRFGFHCRMSRAVIEKKRWQQRKRRMASFFRLHQYPDCRLACTAVHRKDHNAPEVLFECGEHARKPIGTPNHRQRSR